MTRRIDSHHHVWALSRGDYDWLTAQHYPNLLEDYTAADLVPHLEKYGIDASVLIQAADTVAETEYMLSVGAENRFIKAVVGWVDMTAADTPQVLGRLAGDSLLRGIRPSLMNFEPQWLLGHAQQRALKALGALGLVFDALAWPSQLDSLLRAMVREPELGFVINHFGYPDIAGGNISGWKTVMRQFARETHARVKFSGILLGLGDTRSDDDFREVADYLLEHFGPQRIMWGSDWPHLLADSEYDKWYGLSRRLLQGVEPEDLEWIYGKTAALFYGV